MGALQGCCNSPDKGDSERIKPQVNGTPLKEGKAKRDKEVEDGDRRTKADEVGFQPKATGEPQAQQRQENGAGGGFSSQIPPPLDTRQLEKRPQQDDDNMSFASHQSTARSTVSRASSVNSEFLDKRIGSSRGGSTSAIKQTMKAFVKQMIKGREISVLSVDGQIRTCTCSLDRKLKNFIVEISRSSRKIPLSTVSEVFQGKEPEDIDTPLDELCSTMMLESGECISFRFPTEPDRESFAMCLQIIIDGQKD